MPHLGWRPTFRHATRVRVAATCATCLDALWIRAGPRASDARVDGQCACVYVSLAPSGMEISTKKTQQKALGNILIPRFGPAGVDAAAWEEYRRNHPEGFDPRTPLPDVMRDAPKVPTRAVKARPTREQSHAALKSAIGKPTNVRVINVQPPWATMLFEEKDVENRSDAFPADWAIIVQSKANLSKAEWKRRMRDIERRCAWDGASFPSKCPTNQDFYKNTTSQRALGIVKFKSTPNAGVSVGTSSIWNNGDAFAWVVEEAYPFDEPIPYGTGSLGKPFLSTVLGAKPEFRAALERAAADASE